MKPASNNDGLFVDIAVPLPLNSCFTYAVPPHYVHALDVGMRVTVPFSSRRLIGYVVGFRDDGPAGGAKDIGDILDEEPLFDARDLSFYRWVADYYFYPLGQTIKTALPRGLTAEHRPVISITEAGLSLLESGSQSTRGLSLLRELADGNGATLRQLVDRLGRSGLTARITGLREKGLVRVVLQKGRTPVRVRQEKWYRAENCGPQRTTTARQRQIQAWIQDAGAVSLRALRERFGNCTSVLKSLQRKGAVIVEEREVFRRPPVQTRMLAEPTHDLTDEQKAAVAQLAPALRSKTFFPFLLHGVTGSGKTEVYLRVMEQALRAGRQCLYLVPEIALTAQLWDRISSRLTASMAMLHSGLSVAERFDAWRMIRRGDVQIVVGARSAVFASFMDLGAIIVDEEHDPSYKQDEGLRYNARDLALVRGKRSEAVVVLGSATPSFESYYNVLQKKYTLGVLSRRVKNQALPRVNIIDMKGAPASGSKNSIISPQLKQSLEQRLERGEQSLLFLNRRGFAPAYLCRQCGHTFRCPNCAVSLIHHRSRKRLCCHYCDLSLPVPDECPECGSYFLSPMGWGTERLESDIAQHFPGAKLARLDRDTAARRGASRSILEEVYRGDVDILIGTQMVVKGLHLPRVTLVGVICADQSLNFPDHRAGERTFQLLTQVAGRSGRGTIPGEVLVQTYNPGHYSILCAREHDFKKFYKVEARFRKQLGYPPFQRMINLRLEGPDRQALEQCAREIGTLGRHLLQNQGAQAVAFLGPARAPWEKIKGRFRYQMLIKSSSLQDLRTFVAGLLGRAEVQVRARRVKLIVDVDPVFVL